MKISYDSKVDALYVRFTEKRAQVTTQRLTEDISVNYDSKGEIIGIEILDAHEHLKFSGRKPKIRFVPHYKLDQSDAKRQTLHMAQRPSPK